jgi:hypothetical protein
MKKRLKLFSGFLVFAVAAVLFMGAGCNNVFQGDEGGGAIDLPDNERENDGSSADGLSGGDVIFLHHSTGENVWLGGVPEFIDEYNEENGKDYDVRELDFPTDEYAWENFPYDYWNIWVNHEGSSNYRGQPTLETLTSKYDVIAFKHCFPVGYIEPDTGNPSVSSSEKTLENYKAQYEALKDKMHEFKNNKFIVWTGAALIESETEPEYAERTREFFDWVKDEWDEEDDNIYVWDFYELETDGGLYMKDGYSQGDSHPNESFSADVAPLFGQRIVDVIEGRGDSGSIAGE